MANAELDAHLQRLMIEIGNLSYSESALALRLGWFEGDVSRRIDVLRGRGLVASFAAGAGRASRLTPIGRKALATFSHRPPAP